MNCLDLNLFSESLLLDAILCFLMTGVSWFTESRNSHKISYEECTLSPLTTWIPEGYNQEFRDGWYDHQSPDCVPTFRILVPAPRLDFEVEILLWSLKTFIYAKEKWNLLLRSYKGLLRVTPPLLAKSCNYVSQNHLPWMVLV